MNKKKCNKLDVARNMPCKDYKVKRKNENVETDNKAEKKKNVE